MRDAHRRIESSFAVRRLFGREKYGEAGIARRALEGDHAVVLVHERLREREPQTGPALAPGDQRVKDALAQLLGDAWARVPDLHGDGVAVAAARERHLAHHARAQADLTRTRGRFSP